MISINKDGVDFIKMYTDWLRENMTAKPIKDGVFEISSPFLDRHNDHIEIYVVERNGHYILTDDGYTINDLNMSGILLNTPNKKRILQTFLNAYGVDLDSKNNSLYVKCNLTDYPSKKHNLMQAILAVNDMYITSRSHVASLFIEDVEMFLESNNIRSSRDISFVGKSGYIQKYDFVIAGSHNVPERIIKTANRIDKQLAESIIFSWNDTRETRKSNTVLYAFLNDKNSSPSELILNAFHEYGIRPVAWSNREHYIKDLSA